MHANQVASIRLDMESKASANVCPCVLKRECMCTRAARECHTTLLFSGSGRAGTRVIRVAFQGFGGSGVCDKNAPRSFSFFGRSAPTPLISMLATAFIDGARQTGKKTICPNIDLWGRGGPIRHSCSLPLTHTRRAFFSQTPGAKKQSISKVTANANSFPMPLEFLIQKCTAFLPEARCHDGRSCLNLFACRASS
jgi:hypothetical protein